MNSTDIKDLEHELSLMRQAADEAAHTIIHLHKQLEQMSREQLSIHSVIARGQHFDTQLEIIDTHCGPGGVTIIVNDSRSHLI